MHLLLFIFLLLPQQKIETVAITPSSDQPAIVILRSEAEAQFEQLCSDPDIALVFDDGNLVITFKRTDVERFVSDPSAPFERASVRIRKIPIRQISDEDVRAAAIAALAEQDRRLRALAAALNPMPYWVQFVMNGDASVCSSNLKAVRQRKF